MVHCALNERIFKIWISLLGCLKLTTVEQKNMSSPTWSYDEKFYESLVASDENLYIKTDPVKGKGLFAKRKMSQGSKALVETAFCCSQNLDDVSKGIPVCAMCLLSLENPKSIVSRVARNKQLAAELPLIEAFHVRRRHSTPCKFASSGCSALFCSVRCRDQASNTFHHAGCRGKMSDDTQAKLDAFLDESWQQGAVDYSDTHFLAFRFLCIAMTRCRLNKVPLREAYFSIGQLIKAPITRFNFSFLLQEDSSVVELSKEEALALNWVNFLKYKHCPHENPNVVKALKEDPVTKEDMIQRGYALISAIFNFSDDEMCVVSPTVWSELLGAVLLNGQERTPNSPFVEYQEVVSMIQPHDKELKALLKKAKHSGTDTTKFAQSSRGQGIYTVGCLFNHSCEPNLQILYIDANDETLAAFCLRDIEAEEELCISYIDENMHVTHRQQQLFEHYLFECQCRKCVDEIKALEIK